MTTDMEMNVHEAFELLIESLEEAVNGVNRHGAVAFERGDYAAVDAMRARVDAMTALREQVLTLRNEWERLTPLPERETAGKNGQPVSRRDLGRLPPGMRTPEREFEIPILKALVRLGGKARMNDVLDIVGEMMKGKLREVDYQPLPSDPDGMRWRNTAQWTRYTLVKRGEMNPDARHGEWEITSKGRRRVAETQTKGD